MAWVQVGVLAAKPLALLSTQISLSRPVEPPPPKMIISLVVALYTAPWLLRANGGPPVGLSCVQVGVLAAKPLALLSTQVSLSGLPQQSLPPKMIIRLLVSSQMP